MFPRAIDAYRVLPELVWCGFGVLVMLMQPFVRSRHFFTFLALLGTLAGTAASVTAAMHAGPGFGGLVQSDSFSFFFRLLVGTVAFLVVLAAGPYLERERLPFAEFYALLLFATAGMGVLASAQELLTAFIGLEMSSISSYILAGYRRDSLKSSESAMKYFLLGSFATAFFLYGVALVYGSSGTTMLTKMGSEELLNSTLFELGLAMILIGLGLKVAAAPFQVWPRRRSRCGRRTCTKARPRPSLPSSPRVRRPRRLLCCCASLQRFPPPHTSGSGLSGRSRRLRCSPGIWARWCRRTSSGFWRTAPSRTRATFWWLLRPLRSWRAVDRRRQRRLMPQCSFICSATRW